MSVQENGALVAAHDVSRSFGTVRALAGVTLELRGGELVGLVGPDGAGKTTLVRALAGLVDVDAGTVRIRGVPARDANEKARAALGYMPQQYSLYTDLSVDENLRFFADLFALSKRAFEERRERLLALTRLAFAKDRPAGALSGGMYKKLAVACALLHRPEALLLDEPTNGVDPVSRRELWELLYELVGEGMGILVATPYMDEAARCSRVVVLARGRVLLEGAPDALVGAFEHPVRTVTARDRRALDAWLRGASGVLATTPLGRTIRVVLHRDRASDLEAELRARGADVAPARPDFEDLYLARTADASAGAGP